MASRTLDKITRQQQRAAMLACLGFADGIAAHAEQQQQPTWNASFWPGDQPKPTVCSSWMHGMLPQHKYQPPTVFQRTLRSSSMQLLGR